MEFTFELTKKIVTTIEAETYDEAHEIACGFDDGNDDGAWDRAEITTLLIDSE